MVTKKREHKKTKKTIFAKSEQGYFPDMWLKIISIMHPKLYQKYQERKDIQVNFSTAKNTQDILKLRAQFEKKYIDTPSMEQIDIALQEYEASEKNEMQAILMKDCATEIINDLRTIESNKKYQQVIQLLNQNIQNLVNNQEITASNASQQILNKITFKREPLLRFNRLIEHTSLGKRNIPRETILNLTKNLPETVFYSPTPKTGEAIEKYLKPFDQAVNKNRQQTDNKYHFMMLLLLRYKIKTDALRTFDLLAKHHLNKLNKQANKLKQQKLKQDNWNLNHKMGLAHQKIANALGPVDPVARSIAKIKQKIQLTHTKQFAR